MREMLLELIRRSAETMRRRSVRLIASVERNIAYIAAGWAFLLAFILAHRLGQATIDPSWRSLAIHALLVLSPAAGIALAARAFPHSALLALPEIALARIGRWRRLDPISAHSHPSFGASGFMTGLAIGLLFNIVMRTGEFLVAVPSIASEGPGWARTLFFSLAVDCILFNLLYAAAFVMAVRHVPWFPRVLLLVWTMDVVSQILIAQLLGGQGLPGTVAPALTTLLTGNIQKTLISMALWIPYLLLSERVNVTYRRRIRQLA